MDASLTASDAKVNVAKALGFTDAEIAAGFYPLTFNAFDPAESGDAYEALALKSELTCKKIMTVVNTLAAAVEGSGASKADAGAVLACCTAPMPVCPPALNKILTSNHN